MFVLAIIAVPFCFSVRRVLHGLHNLISRLFVVRQTTLICQRMIPRFAAFHLYLI